ncbi:hypothetical protein PCE1_003545 [Barthelona sp. PCE]
MPRVRKFEDDLVIESYPEGRIVFKGKGVTLVNSRDNFDIKSLIASTIEGKDFCGYLEENSKFIQYYYKQKAGTRYIIVEQNFSIENILTGFKILFFNEINSDEHTHRKIPFPFGINQEQFVSRDTFPIDEEHILFSITQIEANNFNGQLQLCYILNIMTGQCRCLGEYNYFSIPTVSSFIILSKHEFDFSLYHYNFSADDMDEAHEPDIVQLEAIPNICIGCYNANCVLFSKYEDGFKEMILIDSQRNRLDLIERFPQLDLKTEFIIGFAILTLTKDEFSALFYDGLLCTVVHIEDEKLKTSSGSLGCYDPHCDEPKHIDLTNSFHDEYCTLYGVCGRTGVYGPIKYRDISGEIMHLSDLQSPISFFDGVAQFSDIDHSSQCFFYFKQKKIVMIKNRTGKNCMYNTLSFHPVEEEYFYMLAQNCDPGQWLKLVKIHWEDTETKPTVTKYYQDEDLDFVCMVLGLPFCLKYEEDGTCYGYLGNSKILEIPHNHYVNDCYAAVDGSVCIYCTNSLHFYKFLIDDDGVKLDKHFISDCNDEILQVFFNHNPIIEINHQLFVTYLCSGDSQMHYLHCLDWSTGSFLKPVLLYQLSSDDDESENMQIEGGRFLNFVGGSYIQVCNGLYKVKIVDGVIKTRFFTNDTLPSVRNHLHNQTLPNNVVQDMSYEEETKTMVLITYNVDEDPESINPTVETFHLPSFLAEASIVEYHMPDYYEGYDDESLN